MADDDDDNAIVELNPILEAMENREPLDVIRAIIDANPDMLRRHNRDGYLPIHYALDQGLPPGVVRHLLRAWPASVFERTKDRGMYLPAHLACLRASEIVVDDDEEEDGIDDDDEEDAVDASISNALQTLQIIFDAGGPETFRWKDTCGRLPMHVLFMFGFPPLPVLQYVVDRFPHALRVKDHVGWIPLHHAVVSADNNNNDAPLPGIHYLIEMWPESLHVESDLGDTPVVRAVREGAPLPIVDHLVKQWPESITRQCERGTTILHVAARAGNLMAAQYFLVRRRPLARVRSRSGQTPLHEAALVGGVAMCQLLVRHGPDALRVANHNGMLPIHEAASNGEVDAVRFLAEMCPESVFHKTPKGWLPVHYAVQFRPGTELALHKAWGSVKFLVAQYPESVGELTSEGFLPLHIAAGLGCFDWDDLVDDSNVQNQIARRAELAYVQFLVGRATPLSVRVLSNDGKLPVHCAVEDGYSLDAIKFLYRTWPESIELRTGNWAQTALHLAVSRDDPMLALVQFLVEQRPELMNEANEGGCLPVHCAASGDLPMEIFRYLVEQNPKSLGRKNMEGSLPLHVCAGANDSYVDPIAPRRLEKARYLVERHPQGLAEPDANGNLPLHAALERFKVSLDLVRLLVEARPESVRRKNAAGMLPLHVAALNREAPLDVLFYLVSHDPESLVLRHDSSGEHCRRQSKRPKLD